jgi:ubiquinone/menaquinone biosynthesis C-methylase UbiE
VSSSAAGESVAFDRVAGSYDATRGGVERGRRLAGVLAEFLPADGPLLEIGVGTGLVAAGLAELGRPPVGVDLSLPMLAVARERIPGRLAAGDAMRLPVGTASVGAVCMIHVLHLVAGIPGALAEVARVLRPGGVLVATAFLKSPVHDDVHDELDRINEQFGVTSRPDDPDLVRELAAAAGFRFLGRREEPGRPVTPANAADSIERRQMAWTWSIDDDLWAREMPAALARIRALPDQDRVRPGPGPSVLAFTHP